MDPELTKKDRLAAAKLIKTGANSEFRQFLLQTDEMIQGWKKNQTDANNTFHLLYDSIIDFNRYMARKYGVLKPEIFFDLIVGLLIEKRISIMDLDKFTVKTKQEILRIVNEREQEKIAPSPGL